MNSSKLGIYSFLFGSISKIIDDLMDMYEKTAINIYFLEFFKIALVIICCKLFTIIRHNYFITFIIASGFLFGIEFPDAYAGEPYWALISCIWVVSVLPLVIKKFKINILHLIVLAFIFLVLNFSSLLLTETEGDPYVRNFFNKMTNNKATFLFEKEPSEVSKKKLFYRLLNTILCIFLLCKGNNMFVNYFNIKDTDFADSLYFISMFSIGYYSLSVINQSYMMYFRDVKYMKNKGGSVKYLPSKNDTNNTTNTIVDKPKNIGKRKKIKKRKERKLQEK